MQCFTGFRPRLPSTIPRLGVVVEGALRGVERRQDVIDYYYGRRVMAAIVTRARVRPMMRFLDDNWLWRLSRGTVARFRPPEWVELPLDQILYKFRILLGRRWAILTQQLDQVYETTRRG